MIKLCAGEMNIPKKKPSKSPKTKKPSTLGFQIEEDVPKPFTVSKNDHLRSEPPEELDDILFGSPEDLRRKELSQSIEVITAEIEDSGPLLPARTHTKLEDFTVLKVIGKGGYGKVYQVQDKLGKEIYAMKVLRKDFLIKTDNVEYTKREKDILRQIRHPFIVRLHYSFQNDSRVYMVMDFLNGGQLLWHMISQSMFSEDQAQFYLAEVILAIEYLHSLDIIHRDIKPENILLDGHGHVSLTDFGFAKDCMEEGSLTRSFCGTMTYMAPEIIEGQGYGKGCDWWGVGILLFDMLTGNPPFRHKDKYTLQQKILNDKLKLPHYFTNAASSLVKGLLNRDPTKRLGCGPQGAIEIKKHQFFKKFDWIKLLNGEISPPIRPNLPKGHMDISNFDEEFTSTTITDSPHQPLSASQNMLFRGFSWCGVDDLSRNSLESTSSTETQDAPL
eukprot:TRINITY_DN2228_c0_g1_i1.p1 TRINITY_DN2228_c0_g1~~TRINITY_DN2228_c0_g1_i1.p1  ORF type:complete len:451 (+),score=96.83 TRINITY_DN2228_c0_g1_i1:22-1353(+)